MIAKINNFAELAKPYYIHTEIHRRINKKIRYTSRCPKLGTKMLQRRDKHALALKQVGFSAEAARRNDKKIPQGANLAGMKKLEIVLIRIRLRKRFI